jgi:hypothetical protein
MAAQLPVERALSFRGMRNERPQIITAEVSKRNVAGAYTDRSEQEIVLFSARHAMKRRREDWRPIDHVWPTKKRAQREAVEYAGLEADQFEVLEVSGGWRIVRTPVAVTINGEVGVAA